VTEEGYSNPRWYMRIFAILFKERTILRKTVDG